MEKDFFKIADQIRKCVRFLQNNADDVAYQCVSECKTLKDVEIKIRADEKTHKIIFTYHIGPNDEEGTWFEVEE